ncbi:MAG: hypothetical protein K2M73_00895 [Lachnospiraceae bacterium]|nr:hypothetical protein [Lachnospiraceae bacterium]
MKQTRYETGIEQIKMIDGAGGEHVIRFLENVAPDLGRYIIETFIQCIPYVGFPRVLNAVFVAKKIFSERQQEKLIDLKHTS